MELCFILVIAWWSGDGLKERWLQISMNENIDRSDQNYI